jgi:hypothetical protein
MIVHRHHDGSEGFEYELDDVVEITGVICNSRWFQRAIGRTGPVVELEGLKRGTRCWRIDPLYVRDLPEWGPSHCMPWQVKPTPETRAGAKVIDTPATAIRRETGEGEA